MPGRWAAIGKAGRLRIMDEIGVRAPYDGEPIHKQWNQLPAAASAEAVHRSLTSALRQAGRPR